MAAPRNILGVSAYYHDSAAALVMDGKIISAAQEERFTRKKNDSDFPRHAAQFCLRHANLTPAQLDGVVFYDKPILKFARLLETYLAVAPGGWRTFPTVLSNWLGEKLDSAGGALGAALAAWHAPAESARAPGPADSMQASLLGPEFSDEEIEKTLRAHNAVFQKMENGALLDFTVELLKTEKVIGWFQGRMEFGPRALGNRSILGDARSPKMQSVINLKVKFRESFRPFAPIVRRERVADFFEMEVASPYMLLVAPVKKELCREVPVEIKGFDRLKSVRSTLPAITHVDYSARIQTVERESNPLLYELLLRFEKATGCGVLVNTSFNVRWEPIVCTPDDAYCCFMNTEMDHLVIGNYLIKRTEQPQQNIPRRILSQAD
jgi:carbamoyltransferase